MTRSYEQLCPVAVALDVVGDRWTLLLLRDLLWHGPMRFGEIDDRNPGLSTSLLTARLRELEVAGLVQRVGRTRAAHYRLTESGQRIRGIIDALYEFGGPLLPQVPLRPEMLAYVVRFVARLRERELLDLDSSATVRLDVDGCATVIAVRPGSMAVTGDSTVDATLQCAQEPFVGMLAGALDLDDAIAAGSATVTGDLAAARLVTRLLRSETPVTA